MISLYIAALAFGGVLVGVSAVLGGDDGHEVDKDLDKDLDGGADKDLDHGALEHSATEHGHAAASIIAWAPWTSLRFWSFGTATFGATGALFSLFGFTDLASVPAASVTGVGVGWAAASFFRALKVDRVSADVHFKRLVGAEGTVVLAVRPGGRGRVKISGAGGVMELSARSGDGRELTIGTRVLVAGVDGDTLDVTGLDDGQRRVAERAGGAREVLGEPSTPTR